jgi:hypothetical protein
MMPLEPWLCHEALLRLMGCERSDAVKLSYLLEFRAAVDAAIATLTEKIARASGGDA